MVSAVELEGVSKRYGETVAADAVTLAIEAGSFATLLGPSGCGKTTLLRLIAGLETPDRGEVRIGGRSMAGVPLHRRRIGLVFQNYALFPHLTVAQNIAFGLRYHGGTESAREKVAAMLDLVRLPGRGEARVDLLSGGQKQRVALARALVIEPEVLLLDEPLSALDANLRDEMRIELRAIQQRLGVTTVFVTHDQGEALAMSDRIAVLRGGRLQQVGSPTELYNRPVSPFVAGFLGPANVLPGRVADIAGKAVLVEVTGCGSFAACAGSPGIIAGERADLVIRAERLHLERAGESGPDRRANQFPGRITAVDYQGPSVRYQIAVGDHRLYAQRALHGEPLRAGSEVLCRADPEHCLAFPQE